MSQGLFNAIFLGSKELETAKKVVRFAVYFGFVFVVLAAILLVTAMFNETINARLEQSFMNTPVLIGMLLVQVLLLYFMSKEKIWAPGILLAITVSDVVLSYIDTRSASTIDLLQVIVYWAALQSILFINKNSESISEAEQSE